MSQVAFIESINCQLLLRITTTDQGITQLDAQHFTCDLTRRGYQQMLAMIVPFGREGSSGYQWLYDLDTPIDFLFSPGGGW